MSISVNDLLKLPSLKASTVIAGERGLNKIVSSISVSEFVDVLKLREIPSDNFGNEILITAFANTKNDIESQCNAVREFALHGVVGLILFYVGIVLPKVDERLIEIADNHDFVLIRMPLNRPDLRYSEVIYEVMETIIKDQDNALNFKNDVLSRVSKMNPQYRSVDTVMRMVSNKFKISVIVTDASSKPLNAVYWPRSFEPVIEELLNYDRDEGAILIEDETYFITCSKISSSNRHTLNIYMVKRGQPLNEEIARQIGETLQIAVDLWSEGYGENVLREFVRAVLLQESYNIRRLAGIFSIDVASICNMVIISYAGSHRNSDLQEILSIAKDEFKSVCQTVISDIYQNNVVVLMNKCNGIMNLRGVCNNLLSTLPEERRNAVVAICYNAPNIARLRQAYNLLESNKPLLEIVYPKKNIYVFRELMFIDNCRRILSKGEESLNKYMSILGEMGSDEQAEQLIDMLAIYLLDADSNTGLTAQMLYLHRNTIKYRLERISEKLGYDIDKRPEVFELYTAVCLRRLMSVKDDLIKPE